MVCSDHKIRKQLKAAERAINSRPITEMNLSLVQNVCFKIFFKYLRAESVKSKKKVKVLKLFSIKDEK